VWHNGGVDGFTTQTFLLPREGVGILASANQHLSNFPLAAVLSIADALLGERAEESWFDRLRPPDASPSAPEPRTVSTGPSHALASYAGSFSNALYGELLVDAGPTGLTARLGEVAVDLTHRHYDTWDLRYEPLEMDAAVTFAADPAGDIAGADVAFELTGDTVRFDRNDSGDAL
jgi:hypothetical protein